MGAILVIAGIFQTAFTTWARYKTTSIYSELIDKIDKVSAGADERTRAQLRSEILGGGYFLQFRGLTLRSTNPGIVMVALGTVLLGLSRVISHWSN